MDPTKKTDPAGVRYEGGRRVVAYANDYEDVQLLISVDPDRYTEDDHDNLCRFVMRAIVAYRGFLRNEQKISEICGLVTFGIPNAVVRIMNKGIVQKVREAFGYALALVLGFEEYEKGFTHEVDPELTQKYGTGFYLGGKE